PSALHTRALPDALPIYARPGIAMRATADSQQVALSMGISVRRIFALSWSIAAVVSAVGGILLATMRGGVDGSLAVLGLKVLPARSEEHTSELQSHLNLV